MLINFYKYKKVNQRFTFFHFDGYQCKYSAPEDGTQKLKQFSSDIYSNKKSAPETNERFGRAVFI